MDTLHILLLLGNCNGKSALSMLHCALLGCQSTSEKDNVHSLGDLCLSLSLSLIFLTHLSLISLFLTHLSLTSLFHLFLSLLYLSYSSLSWRRDAKRWVCYRTSLIFNSWSLPSPTPWNFLSGSPPPSSKDSMADRDSLHSLLKYGDKWTWPHISYYVSSLLQAGLITMALATFTCLECQRSTVYSAIINSSFGFTIGLNHYFVF